MLDGVKDAASEGAWWLPNWAATILIINQAIDTVTWVAGWFT